MLQLILTDDGRGVDPARLRLTEEDLAA